MKSLEGKSVLITGGTGSFGKAFVQRIISLNINVKRLIIFSRDEYKQFLMNNEFSVKEYPFLRYFLGDIRDRDRLYRAFNDVDVVVHAAALKQVPAAEYNPMEFVKTNVLGAENIINAAIDKNVKNVVALSTDKAAAPINLYGATKLCSDKLFVAANNLAGGHNIKFSVVRYGNVMGSRGSVIPFFQQQKSKGILPITDKRMTRFNLPLAESVDLVLHALEKSIGGEIWIPKIPSYRIMDVANAICQTCEKPEIGIRPGEKLHEDLITLADSSSTVDVGNYYAILPQGNGKIKSTYLTQLGAKEVPANFCYTSGDNDQWLNVEDIKDLIEKHL